MTWLLILILVVLFLSAPVELAELAWLLIIGAFWLGLWLSGVLILFLILVN